MSRSPLALLSLAAFAAGSPLAGQEASDAARVKAVEAVCFDYVDGQLEGNPERVARALHPDLAKRSPRPATPDETFALRRMGKDELVDLTRQGVIRTPREKWERTVKVLEITGNAAVARVETPWFVDYFHLGLWNDRWLIVNAMWVPKARPRP